jgi:hypothetical protein
LQNTIEGMRETLPKDLEEMKAVLASMRKPLKRKNCWGAEETTVGVLADADVKEEPGVVKKESEEEEPKPTTAPKREECMSKAELIELHGLTVLDKTASNKAFPVECSKCATIFSGRNRAKIWQHVRGSEHRRRWKTNVPRTAQHVKEEGDSKDMVLGKCKGLRLNSSIGRKTRIGGDLRPSWDVFVQYAHLERSSGFKHET